MCRLYHRCRSKGGHKGGKIIATGTPEEIVKVKKSYTGQFLKKYL